MEVHSKTGFTFDLRCGRRIEPQRHASLKPADLTLSFRTSTFLIRHPSLVRIQTYLPRRSTLHERRIIAKCLVVTNAFCLSSSVASAVPTSRFSRVKDV